MTAIEQAWRVLKNQKSIEEWLNDLPGNAPDYLHDMVAEQDPSDFIGNCPECGSPVDKGMVYPMGGMRWYSCINESCGTSAPINWDTTAFGWDPRAEGGE